MLIDLQVHSTYSDGYLTPTELVDFLKKRGVEVAALTDHNTVAGLEEFRKACQIKGIKAINGLELYVKHRNRQLNFLWYNFDSSIPDLHDLLRDTQLRRRKKVRKALNQLVEKGFKIDVDAVLDKYHKYIPINHVVDEFVSVPENMKRIKKELKTNTPREEEIIDEYFRKKSSGVLKNSFVSLDRILSLKKRIGGQIIFNHPGKYNQLKKPLLTQLKKRGVDGMEVMSPHHGLGALMYAQFIARELDFIETGGSDFHRHEGGTYPIQNSWDYFKIKSDKLRRIGEIIG